MPQSQRYVSYEGIQGLGKIQIDTLPKTSEKLRVGFKPNQKVITPLGEEKIFVGIGPHPNGPICAWLLNPKTNLISHWNATINLEKQNFKLAK